MIGFDFTQELKVTNLRMLNFIKKQLNERQRAESVELKEKDSTFVLSPYETKDADMLSFGTPFPDSNVYSGVNRLFKNQKAFFEKGERDNLKERLEGLLKKDAAMYLGVEKERLEKWAARWIDDEAEGLRQHILKECMNQIASERTLLHGTDKIEEWRMIYEKLQAEGLAI